MNPLPRRIPLPLPSAARRVGAVGVVLGAAAAVGALAGVAAEHAVVSRAVRRSGRSQGPVEPFGQVRGNTRVVLADDGVALFAEVDEPDPHSGALDVTVVFCHGYALNCDAFHYQRQALREVARLVFWDQRGHGRSARGSREHANIDQLGADLARVLEELVPAGPVVLVGHSMGGMTVMAFLERHPHLVRDRVIGVALLSTSPGKLAEVTLGVPAAVGRAARRVAPGVLNTLSRSPGLVDRGRRVGSDFAYVLTRRYSFASDVPPELVEFVLEMNSATPIDVVAELFPAFDAHDKLAALDVLADVECLFLCGERDLMTPQEHSREMHDRVPSARLVLVPDAGHLVLLEHPDVVTAELRELVVRAMRARRAA